MSSPFCFVRNDEWPNQCVCLVRLNHGNSGEICVRPARFSLEIPTHEWRVCSSLARSQRSGARKDRPISQHHTFVHHTNTKSTRGDYVLLCSIGRRRAICVCSALLGWKLHQRERCVLCFTQILQMSKESPRVWKALGFHCMLLFAFLKSCYQEDTCFCFLCSSLLKIDDLKSTCLFWFWNPKELDVWRMDLLKNIMTKLYVSSVCSSHNLRISERATMFSWSQKSKGTKLSLHVFALFSYRPNAWGPMCLLVFYPDVQRTRRKWHGSSLS